MVSVGSVEISVKLALQQLQADAARATQQLQQKFKDIDVELALRTDGAGKQLAQLQQDVLRAKGATASNPKQASQFQKEAALLQEMVRFKQQLAAIDVEFVDPNDIAKAKALAATLNQLNVKRIEQDFKNVGKTAKRELGGVNNLVQGIFQGVGQQATATAFAAISNAIRGIKTAIVGTVGEFVAFDDAIKQAGVISQSTGTPELAALREEVERLGLATSKTPSEIASMTIELSRAGFSATEQIVALEGIVRASEATGDSLVQVGDIIGKTIRTFSMQASESERVADLMTATANNTNSSVVGLGESLAYVGPSAAAANQPLSDTLTLLGLLGDQNIQGSMAGTNLAAALDRLKIASAGGETEFSNLVRGSAKMTEAFNIIGAEARNADGSMKSLLDILPVLQQNMSGLAQTDKDILFKSLFGVEGGRAIQALLNTTAERLDTVNTKIQESEGAARTAGEAMLTGLGGAIDLLLGSLGLLQVKIGESFGPGLEGLARSSVDIINELIQDLEPALANLKEAGAAFTDAINSDAGQAKIAQLGQTLANISSQVLGKLASGLETIAGLIEGEIPPGLQQTIDTLENLSQTAQNLFTLIGNGIDAIDLGGIINDLLRFINLVSEGLNKLSGLILLRQFNDSEGAINSLRDQAQSLTTTLTDAAAKYQVIQKAIESGTATPEQIKQAAELKSQIESLTPAIDGLVSAYQTLNTVYPEQQNGVNTAIDQLENLRSTLESVTGAAEQTPEEIAPGVAPVAPITDSETPTDASSASEQETARIEQEAAAQIAAIRQSQAQRRIATEDAEAQILAVQRRATEQKIALLNEQLKAVAQGSQEEIALKQDLAQLETELAEQTIAEQEQIEAAKEELRRKALEDLERANQQAEAAIAQSQQSEIAAVKQLQLQQRISAEEADRQITAIEARGSKEREQLIRNQLAEVDRLRESGLLSEEDAIDRQIELQDELGDAILQRIDAEIAAQERARAVEIDRLDQQLQSQQTDSEVATGQIDIASSSIDSELQLLQSKNELLTAQRNLRQQTLGFALQEAQAIAQGQIYDERSNKFRRATAAEQRQAERDVRKLRQQQLAEERAAMEQEFTFKKEQLVLQEQQNALEQERQAILADVAIAEAEIALTKAQIAGASPQEIENLEKILELRNDQKDALQEEADTQDKLIQLARDRLDTEQKTAEALQDQNELKAKQEAAANAASSSSSSSSSADPSPSGLKNDDSVEFGKARSAVNAIAQDPNNQVQKLMQLAGKDAFFRGGSGQGFNEALIAKLGNLGDVALKLDAIASQGTLQDRNTATALAKQVDMARQSGDTEFFNKLLTKITELANAASAPKTVNINGGVGSAGTLIRELQKSESAARG